MSRYRFIASHSTPQWHSINSLDLRVRGMDRMTSSVSVTVTEPSRCWSPCLPAAVVDEHDGIPDVTSKGLKQPIGDPGR